MIRYHFHTHPKRGMCCHVYSTESRRELLVWGHKYGFPARWIHEGAMPHFDAWGSRLQNVPAEAARGAGVVGHHTFGTDAKAWRAKALAAAREVGT